MATKTKTQKRKSEGPKQPKAVQKIVNRLIEAEKELGDVATKEGRQYGERWAQDWAEIPELERLEDYVKRGGLKTLHVCLSPFDEICAAICPRLLDRDNFRYSLEREFEDVMLQSDSAVPPNAAFFTGFAEEALKVWHEVKPHVSQVVVQGRRL